ncbi:MAG: ABC transporter permease subunit [Propionibacteriaceae bacterium]|nr:ABC transporter permease subunit [Propionibacteriaceae bacterium]
MAKGRTLTAEEFAALPTTPPKRGNGPWRTESGAVIWQQKETWGHAVRKHWRLYSLCVLPLIYLLIFQYLPLVGTIIAFRRYQPGMGFPWNVVGVSWRGMRYINQFINTPQFWNAFENTVIIAAESLIFTFPLPIILALLLNELRSRRTKRVVQTISYIPHFLSMVIIAGLILQLTLSTGLINEVLMKIHLISQPLSFMQDPKYFRSIYVISQIWQTTGWGTILYLAALTNVDEQLYEASAIDGAGRWRQTLHVTLPGIRPTIVVVLVLNIGSFLGVGFEKIWLIYNPALYSTGDVLSTYLMRNGLFAQPQQASYATAIGLFQSLIGLALIIGANTVSRRLTEASLW